MTNEDFRPFPSDPVRRRPSRASRGSKGSKGSRDRKGSRPRRGSKERKSSTDLQENEEEEEEDSEEEGEKKNILVNCDTDTVSYPENRLLMEFKDACRDGKNGYGPMGGGVCCGGYPYPSPMGPYPFFSPNTCTAIQASLYSIRRLFLGQLSDTVPRHALRSACS